MQSAEELMHLNCGVGEDSWESLGLQGDPTSASSRKSVLHIHWKDWCWSRNSSTLPTWCEELTHLKRPWCWENWRLEEKGTTGWNGWMALPTQWAWVWVNSGSWWWTGRPGVLQSMGWQRVGHNWATELNWWSCSFLNAQTVKNLPALQETWVQSLGWEDPLKEGIATHSSIAWRIPMNQGTWWAIVHGVTKSWTRLND